MQAFDRLGAGFAISARDLDMRGAGDLIGVAQAGHMKVIGVALYQHLLESALRQARGETVDDWTPELKLEVGGRLPEEWIPEAEVRTSLYARLARSRTAAHVDTVEEELIDRFGPLPPEAEALLAIARVRVLARDIGIERIDSGPAAIALTPRRGTEIDAAALGLEEKNGRLLLAERIEDATARLGRLHEVLETAA